MSVPLVDDALRLNRLQAGAAQSDPEEWRSRLRTTVEQPDRHRSFIEYSPESRRLLSQVLEVARGLDWQALPGDDLMHYDFHAGNILTENGTTVSGIVDWDNVMPGDRLVDIAALGLTSLWRSERPVVARIWQEFFITGDAHRRAACMTHTIIWALDWLILYAAGEAADRAVLAGEQALMWLKADGYNST